MYKGKGSQSYSHLHQNLLNKLNAFDAMGSSMDAEVQFYEEERQVPRYDKITELIEKAKGVTSSNQGKLIKAKAGIRRSVKTMNTAFLTGVNIVEPDRVVESHRGYQFDDVQKEEEPSDDYLYLQELNQIKTDDLAELRKMIKETDHRLNNYGRNLSRTKSHVLNAAEKLGKSVDPMLNFRIKQCAQFLPKLERKNSMKKVPAVKK